MTENDISIVGEKIKEIRKSKNISYYDLMYKREPHVHIKSIQRLEDGKGINLTTFFKILKNLNIQFELKKGHKK